MPANAFDARIEQIGGRAAMLDAVVKIVQAHGFPGYGYEHPANHGTIRDRHRTTRQPSNLAKA